MVFDVRKGLLVGLTSILGSVAWAGIDSGGGNAIVLKDDTVVLADPYVKADGLQGSFQCPEGTLGTLAPELIAELRLIGRMMTRYGAAIVDKDTNDIVDPSSKYALDLREMSAFTEHNVLNNVQYCFVDKLPVEYHPPLDHLPDGAHEEQIGWTEGNVTWLRQDIFRKMNLRQQALTLIHERLHAVNGNVPLGPIAELTQSLDKLMGLYFAQRDGSREKLDDSTFALLNNLPQLMSNLNLSSRNDGDTIVRPGYHPVITRNGGGTLIGNSQISDDAFIGVGSLIGSGVVIESGAAVLDTELCTTNIIFQDKIIPKVNIGSGVIIKSTVIPNCPESLVLKSGARMVDSGLLYPILALSYSQAKGASVFLSENSEIFESILVRTQRLELGQGAVVKDVNLSFSKPDPTGLTDEPRGIAFVLGAKAQFLNLNFPSEDVHLHGHWGRHKGWFGHWSKTDEEPSVEVPESVAVDFSGVHYCPERGANEVFPIYAGISVYGQVLVTKPQDLLTQGKELPGNSLFCGP